VRSVGHGHRLLFVTRFDDVERPGPLGLHLSGDSHKVVGHQREDSADTLLFQDYYDTGSDLHIR
jgi:hypothetical protein